MGVLFNDPDVAWDDIYWYNTMALMMSISMNENEGLIVFDEELSTHSCYVELHRKGLFTDSVRIKLLLKS